MTQKPGYVNWPMMTAAVLLCLSLLTTHLLGGMYARYAATDTSADNARVAAFVFDVRDENSTSFLNLEQLDIPGETTEYSFVVTNQNGHVSEVAEEYTIVLDVSECGLPLKLEFSDGTETKTLDMLKDSTVLTEGQLQFSGSFPAGQTHQQSYTLNVIWDEKRNDVSYAEKAATLKMTFIAQQTD